MVSLKAFHWTGPFYKKVRWADGIRFIFSQVSLWSYCSLFRKLAASVVGWDEAGRLREDAKKPIVLGEQPALVESLPERTDLHLQRKLFHLLMGLGIALSYHLGVSSGTMIVGLSVSLGVVLLLEFLRFRSTFLNQKVLQLLGFLMRHNEIQRWSSVPHYLLASMGVIAFCSKTVAILSVLYLACGDPVASLFGILWGGAGPRFKNGKSLVGLLAGIAVCMGVSFYYLSYESHLTKIQMNSISLLGGIVGGLTEFFSSNLEDNLVIPVVSSLFLSVLFFIF